jgi:tRNA nucleotidyltransferase/poly(A) polymerase
MKLLRKYIREAMETKSEPTRMPLNIPIPSDLRKIADTFSAEGQELYIVGGAVRDALLNKSPKDYDLATGAAPDDVLDIVSKDPGSKVDLTGKSFGVVRVWTSEGNEYEIATFRKDIGTGRHPDAVEFTSIEDDVKRRDLTINALFYDMDSREVVDYVGGIEDIKSRTVKAVGDPAQRFQEDKLRILRAARFAARLGADLDPETEAAILSDNDLTEVSPDRIRDEIVKGITAAQDVGHFLELLRNLDLYDQIFPGLQANQNTGVNTKDVPVQLALMLGTNDPAQVKSILRDMKYSNDEVAAVVFLMKFPKITKDSAPSIKKEFGRIKMDPRRLQEFAPAANVPQKIVDSFLKFASAPPAVNPRDLMSQGLKGPEIGMAMQSAESDAYDQMLGELREYIREEFLIEKAKQEASLFSGVSDFIESHHYDDVMDSALRRIAPNMVRHVLEREINEDMSEFLDGATEGRYERLADWAAEDPSPEEYGNPKDSVDYRLGYTWGWSNASTWKSNKLPEQARKEAVEAQIKEFEDQVSEQMVIAALEAANEKVNPIKLLGKAKDAIYDAVQKEGLYAGLKKGLPIAIGIIVGEALDNFIIPMAVFSLTGWVIPPLPVGVGEIINPIIISMVGAGTETEELADELGWYEEEYGAASSLGPREVTEMKITKRQLRRIIREQLEEEENFDEQFIKLMDAEHYDQLFSMADSLGISRPDLPWVPERVQKYISHEFTKERDKRKAASLNPDGTIDFDRYTIPGVSGGEDDEFWEPIFANTNWVIDDYVKNQKKNMDARKRKQYWAKGGYKAGRYRGRQY